MFGTMGKLLEDLKEYFKNTSQEQIDKDFEEIEKYNEIGPSVDEYLSYLRENQKELDPEISKIINKHFWDLI